VSTLKKLKPLLCLALLPAALVACKHPLVIEGRGDIIERLQGLRGCSLDEFNAGLARCTDNNVDSDESVLYQALPRGGWAFSHWLNGCKRAPTSADCSWEYNGDGASFMDEQYPDLTSPPLTAVFVEDSAAPGATRYIASSFGITGNAAYSAYLDALFFDNGSYRYTTLQAGTRSYFNRIPADYARQSDGLLLTGTASTGFDIGGAATANMSLVTLVDTDNSDADVSVAYLTPKLKQAENAHFSGTFYCGRIGTAGAASYFRAVLNGNGGGILTLLSDRLGYSGVRGIGYTVFPDGTTTLDYADVHLAGSLSADGEIFVATQLQASTQGSAICIKASANKTIASVKGTYYGSWISTQPAVAVTEWLIDKSGTTAEAVRIDSFGGSNYSLGTDWVLVNYDGKMSTQTTEGAVSRDGRIIFLVNTNPGKFPTLVLYTR
jgi:hypothetical protein